MVKDLQIFSEYKNRINKVLFHKLVGKLKKELGFNIVDLQINFVSSAQILDINKQFLNHHYSTDIITFNYSGSHSDLDGELFISLEDAQINADKYKATLDEELFRLVIHGILHLLNYDDQNVNDKRIMKSMENKLLNKHKFILLAKREKYDN